MSEEIKDMDRLVGEMIWKEREKLSPNDTDTFVYHYCAAGKISVLHRLTGFQGNVWDTETGFTDNEGKFWLASGEFDIRKLPELTTTQAIEKIKKESNNCRGIDRYGNEDGN